MPALASERDSIAAVSFALRHIAEHDLVTPVPAPVTRCIARLERSRGGPMAVDDFCRGVADALRRLQAGTRTASRARCLRIVVMCDLEGQPHKAVAAQLALSRSQFYRDLQAGRLAVARYLEHLAPPTPRAAEDIAAPPADLPAAHVPVLDAFRIQLAHAGALEQNGNWQAAADILERLASEVTGADRRLAVELRLVRLLGDAQQFARGDAHIQAARRLAQNENSSGASSTAQFDVALARFTESIGESDEAGYLAHKGSAMLRAELHKCNAEHVREALADALTLQAEVFVGRGEFDRGRDSAREAAQILMQGRQPDPQRIVAARSAAAMANLLGARNPEHTYRELTNIYDFAIRCALTREAIVVSIHLAGYLRLMRRPNDEIELLTPLLATARSVGAGGVFAAFLSELLAANLGIGAHNAAATYLAELHACARGNVHMQSVADFSAAKISLAAGDYRAALTSARTALAGFTRIGKPRVAASIVLLQAQALAGLEEIDLALATVRLSIEQLTGRSHPLRLAAAYRLLGMLSGEAGYLQTAGRLTRLVTENKRS